MRSRSSAVLVATALAVAACGSPTPDYQSIWTTSSSPTSTAAAATTEPPVPFPEYLESIGVTGEPVAATGLPEREAPAPVVLSYLVMAGMVLDLPERQALLELPDTTSRLRAERRLLHREDVLISELSSLPAIDLASTEVSPN